jgi:alkylation response protein AidB-like acyl-CoA dehydrogenase
MDQDPFFTSAHKAFRARAREFAEREILPRSHDWDKRATLPREAFRLMANAGLLNILGPKHLGGQALDYVSLGIAIEEIAACDVSCAQIAWIQNTLSHFFPGWGDDTLRALYRGETAIGLAMSEEGAGSDVSAIKTSAIQEGDHFVLNGTKIHVSIMPGADVLAVSCKMCSSAGKEVIGMLRVPTNLPGISARQMPQMGARAHSLGVVQFTNVRVPLDALLGGEGGGKALMYARFNVSRCLSPLAALGAAGAVVRETIKFAREKVVFGRPIATNQSISFTLVEHQTRIEAGRLMAYRALFMNDQGLDAGTDAAMAKWFGITSGIQAISDCLPIFGANGYLADWPIEQRLRDVISLHFTGGTVNIMKLLLVRRLLGDEFAGLRS